MAEYWGMFLPDSVIKRNHPSDHKKASLNINISSKHLSKNTTVTGSPSLKSAWNWDSTGNSYWFVDWKLFKILPAYSQKNPKRTMKVFTTVTWLKIETFQDRDIIVYVPSSGIPWLLSICPDEILPLQACQSHDPHGFTHLLSARLINNNNNNSKGHKTFPALWTIHSFDFQSVTALWFTVRQDIKSLK